MKIHSVRVSELEPSDYSGPIDFLVLPRVSSEGRRRSEAAGGTSLLPNMIRVAAAPPAPNVGSLSPSLAE